MPPEIISVNTESILWAKLIGESILNNSNKTSILLHNIDTNESYPVRQTARRLPFAKRDEVKKLIEEM